MPTGLDLVEPFMALSPRNKSGSAKERGCLMQRARTRYIGGEKIRPVAGYRDDKDPPAGPPCAKEKAARKQTERAHPSNLSSPRQEKPIQPALQASEFAISGSHIAPGDTMVSSAAPIPPAPP